MNLSGSKTILLFFFLPTPLKLHGDVEIYASGCKKDYVAM